MSCDTDLLAWAIGGLRNDDRALLVQPLIAIGVIPMPVGVDDVHGRCCPNLIERRLNLPFWSKANEIRPNDLAVFTSQVDSTARRAGDPRSSLRVYPRLNRLSFIYSSLTGRVGGRALGAGK